MVRGACQAVSGPEQDRWTSCQLHGIVGAYRWITCGVGCILQSNTNSTTLNIPDIKMAKCIHPLPVKHSYIVCYIIHPFNHLCIHACHTRLQCGASNSPWSAVHSKRWYPYVGMDLQTTETAFIHSANERPTDRNFKQHIPIYKPRSGVYVMYVKVGFWLAIADVSHPYICTRVSHTYRSNGTTPFHLPFT